MDFELRIGALTPKLAEQLKSQGFFVPPEATEALQRDIDAAFRLRARGLLSGRISEALERRVHKRICEAISEYHPRPTAST